MSAPVAPFVPQPTDTGWAFVDAAGLRWQVVPWGDGWKLLAPNGDGMGWYACPCEALAHARGGVS